MLCWKKCSDESNLPKSWTFSVLRMLDLECIDQVVKSQIVQKKLRCLLFSYNPSEMGKEQNMGKGNCFNIPLLLVSFFGHHMTMRYDSCGQNVDTFALNYATRSCMYLRSHGYKPNVLVLQTRTNTGTGWTNLGKDCQKVIDFPFLDKLKIQLNKALSNFI